MQMPTDVRMLWSWTSHARFGLGLLLSLVGGSPHAATPASDSTIARFPVIAEAASDDLAPDRATLTGVVKTLDDKPLGRVVIVVDGYATKSGDDGRFVLRGLRAGARQIWVDARPASVTGRAYGTFVLGADLRAGVVNEY